MNRYGGMGDRKGAKRLWERMGLMAIVHAGFYPLCDQSSRPFDLELM